eukprot:TRINITY_DN1241_c0_g2_i3.p1 TRINITY_DN1241_c0_g2~~TRINITY_DN1241_c0_g2_i3.p1  ORF type:complete len:901 (+),score=139.14 TRINITY_DN1241_c0_g2_i3:2952-5654(+)
MEIQYFRRSSFQNTIRFKMSHFFFSLYFLTFLCYRTQAYNWNWMDCHHGVYLSDSDERICQCFPGWQGIDCSMCGADNVCPSSSTCNSSIVVNGNAAMSCIPGGASVFPGLGSMTMQWDFDGFSGGTGVLSTFVHPHGAPFLFNCSFSGCSESVSADQTLMTIDCEKTSCFCSSWCDGFLNQTIFGMSQSAKLICDARTNNCTFTQAQLALPIEATCNATGCQHGPLPPPIPPLSDPEMFILFIGGSAALIACVSAVALTCYATKRIFMEKYELIVDRTPIRATLSWFNVSCTLKAPDGKIRTVLQDVSGVAHPGQVTAILGPSGAGKTTFLDILAGRKNVGTISGVVQVNGKDRRENFSRISGYVLQEDKMFGTFTVREHLNCIAALRLPAGMPSKEKSQRVDEVMEELGISHIADSRIGTDLSRGISGGEKRRVSIASELVTDPSILFLDEPTSGLDSYNAFSLMRTLSVLAKSRNRTILTTIHQPSSNIFSMFDNVILLAAGKLVYFGLGNDVLPYFESIGEECPPNYNPADHVIDLVTMTPFKIDDLCEKYANSAISERVSPKRNPVGLEPSASSASINLDLDLVEGRGAGKSPVHHVDHHGEEEDSPFGSDEEYASLWFVQIGILCKRTLIHSWRNPYLLRSQYIMMSVLAVLIGGIFWKLQLNIQGVQDRAGSLFFLIALLSFGSMSSIDIFFQERSIFVRERATGMYRTSSYFIAKTLCDIVPMRVIPPLMMGGIVYYMIGFQPGWVHFITFQTILLLCSVVATSMCLAISAATPSLSMGNLICILLMLFFMLFGGFLVNKTSMPSFVGWLMWTSFLNYAFEVLMVNELTGLTIQFTPKAYNVSVPVKGEVFLAQFDLEASRMTLDFYVLGAQAAFYLIITYLFLRFLNKERR